MDFPKQPPVVFCKKRCSKKFRKFHRKTPMLESLFNKVAGLKAWNFIKMRFQHRCFPVKFPKTLRTLILKNIYKRLVLDFKVNKYVQYPHFSSNQSK